MKLCNTIENYSSKLKTMGFSKQRYYKIKIYNGKNYDFTCIPMNYYTENHGTLINHRKTMLLYQTYGAYAIPKTMKL